MTADELGLTGALDGIRVIEVGTLISGPFCGPVARRYGRRCQKSSRRAPDPVRNWGQAEVDGHHVLTVHARNKAGCDAESARNRGPRSVPRARRTLGHRGRNFRPGTLEKWGLATTSCAMQPRHHPGAGLRLMGRPADAHKAGYIGPLRPPAVCVT